MATRFTHSARINAPVEIVFSSYGEEAFWLDRLATVGTAEDTLDDLVVADDAITVTLTQHIADEDIPDVARKVLPGQLVIVRNITFTDFDGERYLSSSRADAAGGLARIEGGTEAVSAGDAAVESLTGQVKVSVPLLGGKLEKLVVSHLDGAFEAEYRHLNHWVARS